MLTDFAADTLSSPTVMEDRYALAPSIVPEENPNGLAIVRLPPDARTDLKIEIGHVLCIDVVGYSKLLIHAQTEVLRDLNEVVRRTAQCRVSAHEGKLLRLPTGDGMVLVFRESPEAPARCALEISEALKGNPHLQLRMGIHSGPVNEVRDVNERTNLAGAGINIAQRVMDCGDAGHILLSKHVAEDLEHYARWQPHLHEAGEYEVKHGQLLRVVNLYTGSLGNPALPRKLDEFRKARPCATGHPMNQKWLLLFVLLLLGCALAAAFWPVLRRSQENYGIAGSANSLPTSEIPSKSIAVLPFENLSANQETEFFTEGVQDEILTNLAKVSELKVISRTSVMQYKTVRARNLREIGRQLGVAHVLEGSVQRAGNSIRVNAQLIDARTDTHLWAQVYDRSLADVFAIQSEIARTIADQLQAKLSPREMNALAEAPTKDLVAERLFRQALQQVEVASNPDAKEALLKAVDLLNEALERDPKFVRASSLLTTAHVDLYWQGFDHTPARLEMARQAIENAAKFHPDAGEVHLMRGDYAYKAFRDYARARDELELARPTLPNNPLIPVYTAALDRRQGRWEESLKNWQRALDLDPRNFRYLIETGFTYQAMRRFEEARRLYERAVLLKPDDQFTRSQLALVPFLADGEVKPWRTQLNSIIDQEPQAATEIANGLFDCAMAERDRQLVIRAVESIRPEGLRDVYNNSLWSREWFVGLAARTFGDEMQASRAFRAARALEQRKVLEQPDYAPAWSRLSLIDAALGQKADAILEAEKACELLPVAKDTVDGPSNVTHLAMVYAWVGEKDRALQALAHSAQLPCGITYGELKLMPQWDALRSDPRFQQILASLAPKVPATR